MYAYLYITSQNDNFSGVVEDKLLSEFPPWRRKNKTYQNPAQT